MKKDLKVLAYKGLEDKNINNKEYIDRLKKELDLIKDTIIEKRLVYMYDVIKTIRDSGFFTTDCNGTPNCSLVAYCLGITILDPLRYDLPFERFFFSFERYPYVLDMDIEKGKKEEATTYLFSQKYLSETSSDKNKEDTTELFRLNEIDYGFVKDSIKTLELLCSPSLEKNKQSHVIFSIDQKAFYPEDFNEIVNAITAHSAYPQYEIFDLIKDRNNPVTSGYKDIDEILDTSYGKIYYQEQGLHLLNRIGGLSLKEAEIFRQALCRMHKFYNDEYKMRFVKEAQCKDIEKGYASDLFDNIVSILPYARLRAHFIKEAKVKCLKEFCANNLS